MDPEASRTLLASMAPVHVARGEVLFHEGEPGDRLYVIRSGKIKLGRRSSDGRENLLAVPGLADAVVLELGHHDLIPWLEQNPTVAKHLLGALGRRLRRTNDALADLVFSDVPGRVAKALLDLSHRFGQQTDEGVRVAHDLTQEELAQLVGASRETVNKALADFAARGWVRREGRAVVLLDVDRLERRAR